MNSLMIWRDAFNKRNSRERLLLCGSLLAILFLAWSLLIQGPIDARLSEQRLALDALQKKMVTATDNVVAATSALSADPVRLKQRELERVKEKVDEVDRILATLSNGLVPAEQLPLALSELLAKVDGLQVISVNTLPAEELALANYLSGTEEIAGGLYKHRLVVRLTADYRETIALVKAIEHLSWKFYWELLDYRVDVFPRATIELRVYVLSSEEGRLGV